MKLLSKISMLVSLALQCRVISTLYQARLESFQLSPDNRLLCDNIADHSRKEGDVLKERSCSVVLLLRRMARHRHLLTRVYLLQIIKKYFRTAPRQNLITASFTAGLILGLLPTLYLLFQNNHVSSRTPKTAIASSTSIQATRYDYATPRKPSYAFFFTTGRSGTQHYSRILTHPDAYITHEQEHPIIPTKNVVTSVYRRLSSTSPNLTVFNTQVTNYLLNHKLPYLHSLTRLSHKSRYIYTGHVPLAFGHGPSLIKALPEGSLRIVRARRDRITTALSLMALGPSEEDSWDENNEMPLIRRRWFPKPDDIFTRLKVKKSIWEKLNRFQRYLWYIDDIECRWQNLKKQGGFQWLEIELESLECFDDGDGYKQLAKFLGVNFRRELFGKRDNSMQKKRREKLLVSEQVLRNWDEQYKTLVGPCLLEDDHFYRWINVR